MGLKILKGSGSSLNQHLLHFAVKSRPSLIIDCSNCADPHAIYKYANDFEGVYVIEVELLYAFRDVLKVIPKLVRELNTKVIVITAFHYLINYHNDHENKQVAKHCMEIIHELSISHNMVLGLHNGTHSKKSKDGIGFVVR
jgi:hypothetical protein